MGFVSLTESTRLFASDMGANDRPRGCDIYLFVGGERKTYSMYLVVLGLHRLPPLQTTALLGGGGVVHYSKKREGIKHG